MTLIGEVKGKRYLVWSFREGCHNSACSTCILPSLFLKASFYFSPALISFFSYSETSGDGSRF